MDERQPYECVVVFHAHPDDEAIFTGGTIARLTDAGIRAVVVIATHGAPGDGSPLAALRMEEARVACERLGAHRLVLLGHADSGLDGNGAVPLDAAFCRQPVDVVAAQLAEVLCDERADALITYDEGGIYGHPDHIAVHRVGAAAAALAGVATVYESTVDREYLHFVETHLVGHAVQSLLGMEIAATNAAPLGVPTVEVTTTVDVRAQAARKRAAMAAHASQIAPDSETMTMDAETFDGVYGFEWYVRKGPKGPLERIAF
jgi:LmbE family N-acetylglucosaminyl deacetylase